LTHHAVGAVSAVSRREQKTLVGLGYDHIGDDDDKGGQILTRKQLAKDEDGNGENENQCRYPAYRTNIVEIDSCIPSSPIGFCLDILFGDFVTVLTLCIPWRCLIKMLFGCKVPIRGWQVKARDVASGSIELVVIALFDNLAVAIKRNYMITIRKAFCCGKGSECRSGRVESTDPYLMKKQSEPLIGTYGVGHRAQKDYAKLDSRSESRVR
jgi:hypothetical protein